MKYAITVNNEGKLVYVDGKGKEKDFTLTKAAACKISELYGKAQSVPAVSTPVAPITPAVTPETKDKYGVKIIPEDLLGFPGVMKGDKGLYYIMCTCCGSAITPSQARFGIKEYKQAMCIDCQRKFRKDHKIFLCPEVRFSKEIKFHKPCQNEGCKREVTGMQTSLSLAVTNGKYRLCPTCLAKYAKTTRPAQVTEAASVPVVPVQTKVEERLVALEDGPSI